MGNVCSEHKSADAQDVCIWVDPQLDLSKQNLSFEKIAGALELSPSLAFSIVRNRAWDAPRLAQVAIRTGKGVATMALTSAIEREYIRTLGSGPNANYLFRSTLRLEGEGAERLQAEMRALVGRVEHSNPDRETPDPLAAPIETKDAVAKRAAQDPGYGRLYANFFDAPEAAVEQLRVEYNQRPEEFAKHIAHLASMVLTSPSSAEAVVDAASKLEGNDAGPVQVAIARQLYKAMGRDMAVTRASKEGLHQDAKSYRIRAQRLVSLLATLVSKPEAARSLVLASHEGGASEDPSLRQLMEAILLTAYDQATQIRVRARITLGAAAMLDRSALAPEAADRRDMGSTAGTFLGTAASAEEAVGLEETTAAAVARIIEQGGSALPGHYKMIAKGAAFIIGKASKDHETDWSKEAVNGLLHEVYSAVRPSPDGNTRPHGMPSASKAQRAYQNEFEEWRDVPYQAFQTSNKEKK